jgi:hypothetical protein
VEALEHCSMNREHVIVWIASVAVTLAVSAILAEAFDAKTAAALAPGVALLAHKAFDAKVATQLHRALG